MDETGINGLEPDRIAEELNILVDAYMDEIPDGKNGAVSDAIYTTLQSKIDLVANELSNVTSIGDAQQKVEDIFFEEALEAAQSADPSFPPERIQGYVERVVGQIEGLMIGLGFTPENIDESAL